MNRDPDDYTNIVSLICMWYLWISEVWMLNGLGDQAHVKEMHILIEIR